MEYTKHFLQRIHVAVFVSLKVASVDHALLYAVSESVSPVSSTSNEWSECVLSAVGRDGRSHSDRALPCLECAVHDRLLSAGHGGEVDDQLAGMHLVVVRCSLSDLQTIQRLRAAFQWALNNA